MINTEFVNVSLQVKCIEDLWCLPQVLPAFDLAKNRQLYAFKSPDSDKCIRFAYYREVRDDSVLEKGTVVINISNSTVPRIEQEFVESDGVLDIKLIKLSKDHIVSIP